MPLNSHMEDNRDGAAAGVLYVVATPIGNMRDITLRALDTLKHVDVVAAEDTRQTGLLLAHHQISARLVSYHEHNEAERTPHLIERLESGKKVALVCTAGTPAISDPGYRLVKTAISRNITVRPIPGVSAVISALSVSGLPTDAFIFIGFLPRKQNKRIAQLKALADELRTIIFYESPRRIESLLKEIYKYMGDRESMLSREMTKPHEEFLRGPVSGILKELEARAAVKGECTLLVSGRAKGETIKREDLIKEIHFALSTSKRSLGDISKTIAKKYNVTRQLVYSEGVKIKKGIINEES